MMRLSRMISGFTLSLFFVFYAGQCQAQEQVAAQTKTIFDYQKDLALSQKQVESLKNLLAGLQVKVQDARKKMVEFRQKLADLVRDEASVAMIRKQLEQISAVQIDTTCMDLEVARQVNAVLTPSQLKQWRDIQKKYRQEEAIEKAKAAKK